MSITLPAGTYILSLQVFCEFAAFHLDFLSVQVLKIRSKITILCVKRQRENVYLLFLLFFGAIIS